MKRNSVWPQVGLFVLLALGVSLLWAIISTLVIDAVVRPAAVFSYNVDVLHFDGQGEPYIIHNTVADNRYQESQYRSLDGEAIDRPRMYPAYATLDKRDAYPNRALFERGALPWSERLLSASDFLSSPKTWFIVRDASGEGRAYVVGYDELSRRSMGYIGRDGYSFNVMPPLDEHFQLGSDYLSSRVVGHGLGRYGRQELSGQSSLPQWCIYIVDDNRVVEVDLREKRVRAIVEAPEVTSIDMLVEPTLTRDEQRGDGATEVESTGSGQDRLAVRLDDRVVIIDPSSDDDGRTDFILPESVRAGARMDFYRINETDAVVDQYIGNYVDDNVHRLIWFTSAGAVTREETIELDYGRSTSARFDLSTAAAAMPQPVTWALASVIVPLSQGAYWRASSYGESLSNMAAEFWPAGLVLIVLSAAGAWAVVRQQRQNGRPQTPLWTLLVFLFGAPGLIAYLLQHRAAPLGACAACGATTPRTREACTKCGAERAGPRMTGTEVFA